MARHDPPVAVKLIYQVFAKLLSWMMLHARSDTTNEIEIRPRTRRHHESGAEGLLPIPLRQLRLAAASAGMMRTGQLSRVRLALLALCAVLVVGTLGYLALGFGLLDAIYQTVTTVTTVGFREVEPLNPAGQVFTIVLILVGVGTALYALGALLEGVGEGDVRDAPGKATNGPHDQPDERPRHRLRVGPGRNVQRAVLAGTGLQIVAVDRDPERVRGVVDPHGARRRDR